MMTQSKPLVSIENIVASATIEQPLDLDDITKKFSCVECNPDIFSWVVFRLENPKTTLLFRTGKMMCIGAKSEDMARKAVTTVVQKMRKEKIGIKNEAVVIVQNIEASINLCACLV
jgi:transcription initiation factor TFIID TATA-box-binding protein